MNAYLRADFRVRQLRAHDSSGSRVNVGFLTDSRLGDLQAFAARLPCPVKSADDYGWRGDAIEAEAFAYLAARTVRGLPISFPKTTGVPAPMTGGRIAQPTKARA